MTNNISIKCWQCGTHLYTMKNTSKEELKKPLAVFCDEKCEQSYEKLKQLALKYAHTGGAIVNQKTTTDYAALERIAINDTKVLFDKGRSYGDSWCKRGGIGSAMMLARKWDRLENQCEKYGWDIFKALAEDRRQEGLIDDIRDLRRYLFLVEEYAARKGLLDCRDKENEQGAEPDSGYVCQDPDLKPYKAVKLGDEQ